MNGMESREGKGRRQVGGGGGNSISIYMFDGRFKKSTA
jgi:hypothetical protein